MRRGRLLVLVLLAAVVGQDALALALLPQQTWAIGIFGDAPQADTPAVVSDVVLVPCIASRPSNPAVAVGHVSATLEPRVSALPLEASRGRAPPLA